MVTVTNYFVQKNKEGKLFISLELTGDVQAIQSSETGRFYLTAKRSRLASTFSEDIAKTLVGKQLPGKIERIQCEPYDYAVEETGEVISLMHTYVYNPEEEQEMLSLKGHRSLVDA